MMKFIWIAKKLRCTYKKTTTTTHTKTETKHGCATEDEPDYRGVPMTNPENLVKWEIHDKPTQKKEEQTKATHCWETTVAAAG